MNFTEKETLTDALIAHKFLINMYTQFGIECSNKQLRDLFLDNQKITMEHDLKLYQIMNKKGYYPTSAAASKDVKQTLKMHTQMQEELKGKLAKQEKA